MRTGYAADALSQLQSCLLERAHSHHLHCHFNSDWTHAVVGNGLVLDSYTSVVFPVIFFFRVSFGEFVSLFCFIGMVRAHFFAPALDIFLFTSLPHYPPSILLFTFCHLPFTLAYPIIPAFQSSCLPLPYLSLHSLRFCDLFPLLTIHIFAYPIASSFFFLHLYVCRGLYRTLCLSFCNPSLGKDVDIGSKPKEDKRHLFSL